MAKMDLRRVGAVYIGSDIKWTSHAKIIYDVSSLRRLRVVCLAMLETSPVVRKSRLPRDAS